MRRGDGLDDGQTKPCALRARREKRLEHVCAQLVRNAGTVIGDTQMDRVAETVPMQQNIGATVAGLISIRDQVEQRTFQGILVYRDAQGLVRH